MHRGKNTGETARSWVSGDVSCILVKNLEQDQHRGQQPGGLNSAEQD